MIISKRADKVKLDDRLVRPDQSVIAEGVSLIREHGNTIELQWWQGPLVPTTGLVVLVDGGGQWQQLVGLRLNRYEHVNVFIPG